MAMQTRDAPRRYFTRKKISCLHFLLDRTLLPWQQVIGHLAPPSLSPLRQTPPMAFGMLLGRVDLCGENWLRFPPIAPRTRGLLVFSMEGSSLSPSGHGVIPPSRRRSPVTVRLPPIVISECTPSPFQDRCDANRKAFLTGFFPHSPSLCTTSNFAVASIGPFLLSLSPARCVSFFLSTRQREISIGFSDFRTPALRTLPFVR